MNIAPKSVRSELKNKIMTTKFNEVNVRNGPGLNHLKIYKILKKGYPLFVIDKFENWRKIIDINGIIGWVASSQLSGKHHVIVNVYQDYIYKFPLEKSKKVAIVKKNFIFEMKKCNPKWCLVKNKDIHGWIKKSSLWKTDYY